MVLDEVFSSSNRGTGQANTRAGVESVSSSFVNSNTRMSAKFEASHRSAEMRCGILTNELDEARAELEIVRKRKNNLKLGISILSNKGLNYYLFIVCANTASEHLTSVRSEVLEKIRLLQEEVGLINSHLSDQKTKYEEVRAQRLKFFR